MSVNPVGAIAVPLTVFGSWVTEVPPEAVPENISPDCGDISFAPGEVGSRPALEAIVFTPPLAPNTTCTYGKSFVTPTGDIKNLYLFSNGQLFVEDLTNSPLTATLLYSTAPGSYARSVTSFGREYIAISDGLHGTEVPLQYDGTFLDRLTQDGCGSAPLVQNLIIPASTLAATAPPPTGVPVSAVLYSGRQFIGGVSVYTTVDVTLVMGTPHTFNPGDTVSISGNSNSTVNAGDYYVISQTNTYHLVLGFSGGPSSVFAAGSGGVLDGSVVTGNTLVRLNNIVTATTGTPHGLLVGYQAQISKVTATTPIGGSLVSIVVNNEDSPGIATVTTSSAHGLLPQNQVSITGVEPTAVGGGIASIGRAGDVATCVTSSPHQLTLGAVVNIAGVSDGTFNGSWVVATIPGPTVFTFADTDSDATSSGGTVTVSWPIPDNTPTPTYFEVLSAPTPTTFQVQITTADGMWTTGAVSFGWDGTFYVTNVTSTTSFQYQQYGPNANSSDAGTVTPFGQAAPGLHLVQLLFLDRQGGITSPSPPTPFIANGGQYISVSNLAVGASNIVARILAFTGAQPNVPGLLPPFFYIPVPAQLEGQTVGTATQINDNTTDSVILDFSDNSLFAAVGISIPGNTLLNQIVLDGALGFSSYGTRLLTWGQRNVVNRLLNMGFDGGYLPSAPTLPTGWVYPGTFGTGQIIATSPVAGFAWQITCDGSANPCGELTQGAYEDAYGAPILNGDTPYLYRLKITTVTGTNGDFVATLSSPVVGLIATATIALPATAGTAYYQADFSAQTPTNISPDTILSVYVKSAGSGQVVTLDEMKLIFAQTPYTDHLSYASYIGNPAGMDGVSGQFGPSDDSSKLMDMAVLRDTLYLVTQAPSGRLHETNGSGVTEPSGWSVDEVAANCGTLSAFGLTHSQADDTAASGGDDWMAWPSEGGAMIFGGGQPEKISQELQPNWFDPTKADTSVQINMSAALTTWCVNDPVQRLLFFGLPIGSSTAPNKIYVLNYRNLNSASAIAGSPPFHPSFSGKLVATDNSRKWAPWNMTMNGAARMYRTPGVLSLVMLGGNGATVGTGGFGNVYTLNPARYTDDDFGLIAPFYTTYFHLDPEKAQGLQLNVGRLMLSYQTMFCSALANVSVTMLCDVLTNPWNIVITRQPGLNPTFDVEMGGGYAQAQRMAFRIASSPLAGQTDNSFNLSRFVAYFKNARMQIRGSSH